MLNIFGCLRPVISSSNHLIHFKKKLNEIFCCLTCLSSYLHGYMRALCLCTLIVLYSKTMQTQLKLAASLSRVYRKLNSGELLQLA